MSESTAKGGRSDRDLVAAGQDHEVAYVATKFSITKQEVLDAIKAVGNERDKVYEYLKSRGANG